MKVWIVLTMYGGLVQDINVFSEMTLAESSIENMGQQGKYYLKAHKDSDHNALDIYYKEYGTDKLEIFLYEEEVITPEKSFEDGL